MQLKNIIINYPMMEISIISFVTFKTLKFSNKRKELIKENCMRGKNKAMDKCCILMGFIIKDCGKTINEMVWV